MTWTLADVDRSVPDAFSEQARLRPDKPAISGTPHPATYGELDAAGNRHARLVLERCGPDPGRVALLMDDDSPLVAAKLGALKAGKTAVVINPADPPGRVAQIVEDARPQLVLTDADHAEVARSAGLADYRLVTLEEQGADFPADPPDVEVDPGRIAFLLYTSGSTGRPKGVIQTHRTFLHMMGRFTNSVDLGPDDRVSLFTSLGGFGGSGVLWGALLNGGTVCPFLISDRGMTGLAQWSSEQRVTLMFSFPSVFRHLVQTLEDTPPPPLRVLMLGGEAVMPADYEAARRVFGSDCGFTCVLGATETGLLALNWVTGEVDPDGGPVPPGPIIDWVDVLLLDEEGREVPSGETGEITVRNRYLTPGYWDDEALNAARFIEDESGRLFRTGDLGRFSPDGVLSMVGRRDLQVKVRGNRVSITEIEGAIAALPEVTGAAVCANTTDRGDTRLTAYLTTRPGASLTPQSLREALRRTLPDREIPTGFVFVDSFPFTTRGKVDRERLAEMAVPSEARAEDDGSRESSEAEKRLAEIWSSAFEVEHVGREDDFFELGGDSLTAAVMAAAVHASFGVELDLGAFADNPTVARLAELIEQRQSQPGGDDRPSLVRVSRDEPAPMSFAQERTWRTSQTPEEAAGYTDATIIRIRGPLDVDVFRRAVDHFARRHEMLRTTFTERDGRPVQVVHPPAPIEIPLIDLADAPDAGEQASRMLAEVAALPFDLRQGPLLRLRLVRTAPDEHRLLWVDHHIISDAGSWKVFLDELRILYEAFARGEEAPLPGEMPFQYADFAAWERGWLHPTTPHFQSEMAWWRETLGDAPLPPRLPFARETPKPDADPDDGVQFWGLAPEVTRELDRVGREGAATYYMVRLAVLAAQLASETGSYDLVLGTYASGRAAAETQRMFGFFANAVTLRLHLDPDLPFREVLARVRRSVIETSPHSDFPYELLCEHLRAEGIVPPEIQLIFNPADQRPPRIAGLELEMMRRKYEGMPWGFTFGLNRYREDSDCGVAFDARIHDPGEVREFVGRYERLAAALCAEPERPLGAVPAHT